jgi:hypothetical protein
MRRARKERAQGGSSAQRESRRDVAEAEQEQGFHRFHDGLPRRIG